MQHDDAVEEVKRNLMMEVLADPDAFMDKITAILACIEKLKERARNREGTIVYEMIADWSIGLSVNLGGVPRADRDAWQLSARLVHPEPSTAKDAGWMTTWGRLGMIVAAFEVREENGAPPPPTLGDPAAVHHWAWLEERPIVQPS